MENRKQQIIMATLELASQIGLGAVSMNMIAEKVGIRKPSLYNHFTSKDELVEETYNFLREQAKGGMGDLRVDFEGKSASEILKTMAHNYIAMCSQPNIEMFYKVIYCERAINPSASKIMTQETEKMIEATKQVFALLQQKRLLSFGNLNISALSFALTIHSIMDYEADKSFADKGKMRRDIELLDEYIDSFCAEHSSGR